MRRPGRLARLLVVAACAAATAEGASGQTLRGSLVDTSSEAPVAGAALQLATPDSQVVAYGVTDEGGRFSLTAPRAGEYELRVAKPGYQPARLGPLRLRVGEPLEITVALGRAVTPVDTTDVVVHGGAPPRFRTPRRR